MNFLPFDLQIGVNDTINVLEGKKRRQTSRQADWQRQNKSDKRLYPDVIGYIHELWVCNGSIYKSILHRHLTYSPQIASAGANGTLFTVAHRLT